MKQESQWNFHLPDNADITIYIQVFLGQCWKKQTNKKPQLPLKNTYSQICFREVIFK